MQPQCIHVCVLCVCACMRAGIRSMHQALLLNLARRYHWSKKDQTILFEIIKRTTFEAIQRSKQHSTHTHTHKTAQIG